MRHLFPAVLFVLSCCIQARAHSDDPGPAPAIMSCLRVDASAKGQPLEALRHAGPAGLRALFAEYDKSPSTVSAADVDAVAAQHDALCSRLYWYTDLDAAKAAARAEHKPILYLRLLGKLTDEYSCANSRFFRTVLYANANVSKLLRERFVLVWASERPVPIVTIDYGDGRVLKRTITGNSIHYVLDADGSVVDALPGLYDPVKFSELVTAAADAAMTTSIESRREYWERSRAALAAEWRRDSGGETSTSSPLPMPFLTTPAAPAPHAADAMPRAMSKGRVESPLVRAAFPPPQPQPQSAPKPNAVAAARRADGKSIVEIPMLARLSDDFAQQLSEAAESADDATWERIASRHLNDARLDPNSIALMRSQDPSATKDSEPFDRTITRFERSIAADTVRNNYRFRSQILAWLAQDASSVPGPDLDLNRLNERVYSELFLTPRSDAWLGLVPESTYSALSNNGCNRSQ